MGKNIFIVIHWLNHTNCWSGEKTSWYKMFFSLYQQHQRLYRVWRALVSWAAASWQRVSLQRQHSNAFQSLQRETPTHRPEAKTLFPQICPKTVWASFETLRIVHNICSFMIVYISFHKMWREFKFQFGFNDRSLRFKTPIVGQFYLIN